MARSKAASGSKARGRPRWAGAVFDLIPIGKINHLTPFVHSLVVYHSIHNSTKNERKQLSRTYKAVQVTQPGKLNLVALPIREPGPGQGRLRVEACGVCHSDIATVEGQFPGLILPRVPGHEVVGRIDAVGPD